MALDDWKTESLTEGGQSRIFVAQRDGDPNKYALKRLKNLDRIERFKNEIESCLKLRHPNIIEVVEYNLSKPKPYLVIPFYELGSLSELDLEKISPLDKFKLFSKICNAVKYAHGNNIIHRDLKPDNILMKDDHTPIVSDFGLCFLETNVGRVTITDEVVGSRHFIAPEYEDGRLETVTQTSDIYSMGKILYWLFANKVTFAREKHRDPNYFLLGSSDEGYLYLVYNLLDKTITEPAQRYSSIGELCSAIDTTIFVLEHDGRVLNKSAKKPCLFCRRGIYRIEVAPPNHKYGNLTDSFGLKPSNYSEYLILVCDFCGHVQYFHSSSLGDGSFNPNWKLT
ncbi:serine/threonine protein kinase [bacterium]|nr:serine/threonine protein kinase [bacterium]